MEWFFKIVGTELISALIGCIIGSGVTYRIMYNKYIKTTVVKQIQKSGKKSNQTQIGVINGKK